jgi:hypothetical protein
MAQQLVSVGRTGNAQQVFVGNTEQFARPQTFPLAGSFRYFLASLWIETLDTAHTLHVWPSYALNGSDQYGIKLDIAPGGLTVTIGHGTPTVSTIAFPVTLPTGLCHLLLSLDTVTFTAPTCLLYVNDALVAGTFTGAGGAAAEAASLAALMVTLVSTYPATYADALQRLAFTSPYPWDADAPNYEYCVGDFYLTSPAAFFDLTSTPNRRQFINADLTAVDLGSSASAPLGEVPILWLTSIDGDLGFPFNRSPGPNLLATTTVVACPALPPGLLPGVPDPGPDPHPGTAPGSNPAPGTMMVALLPEAELQFCDANGEPYAGGTLETYIRGTQTAKATWVTPEGGDGNLNTNPITLDSAGRCILYGDGAYRTILRDALGNLIWDQPTSTLVSVAMAPVVAAPTIAAAVVLLGIADMIAAEATARVAGDAAEAAARAAAIAAEAAARAAADTAEATRAEAAEAALGARIDAIPAVVVPNAQGGYVDTGGDGHARVTFPVAFAAAPAVTITALGTVFASVTFVALPDATGVDIFATIAGSGVHAPGIGVMWIAVGS